MIWRRTGTRRRSRRPMWSPKPAGRSRSRLKSVALWRRLGWGLAGLVLFGTLGWGGWWGYQQAEPTLHEWFRLRDIAVDGTDHVTRQAVLDQLALGDDETMWTLNPADLAERLRRHPWIKDARVSRALPHRLEVAIVERAPSAVLKADTALLLLDGEGAVLEPVSDTTDRSLPVLVGVKPAQLETGDKPSRALVRNGIRLAGLLGDEFEGQLEINLADPDNAVAYVDGYKFQFGPSAFEEKWERFRKIDHPVNGGTAEGAANEIDLRFPGKVIVRERGE